MATSRRRVATIHCTRTCDKMWVFVIDEHGDTTTYQFPRAGAMMILPKENVLMGFTEGFWDSPHILFNVDRCPEDDELRDVWWGMPGAVNWDEGAQTYRLRSSFECHLDDACVYEGFDHLWGLIDCCQSKEKFDKYEKHTEIYLDSGCDIPVAFVKDSVSGDLRIVISRDDADNLIDHDDADQFLKEINIDYTGYLQNGVVPGYEDDDED